MTPEERVRRQLVNFHKVLFYLADTLTDISPEQLGMEINLKLKQIKYETGEIRWYATQSIIRTEGGDDSETKEI